MIYIFQKDIVDEDVCRELVYFYGTPMTEMIERIKEVPSAKTIFCFTNLHLAYFSGTSIISLLLI